MGVIKVVIELRGMQFWSEIILVISNQTRAAREITRMISVQIALHSVQSPHYKLVHSFTNRPGSGCPVLTIGKRS